MSALPTCTCVVPTYRRREALARLLAGIAAQLGDPAARAGFDVLVVVDGSTDGTRELVAALDYPVPLAAVWQPNAGLAAARNRGLAAARGEIVWFLDDDMTPADGLVARHRAAHAGGAERLVVGPCLPPPGRPVLAAVRHWAERQYAELAAAGAVRDARYFSAANTSGPARLWRGAGGFDERLRGWGGEDYELGLRLLRAGVEIAYDPEALAWHEQVRTVAAFCRDCRDQGRNAVRIAELHPDAAGDLFPRGSASLGLRALGRLCRGRPGRWRAAAALAAAAAAAEARLPGDRAGALRLARAASRLAGSAELDPDGRLTSRLFERSPVGPPR